ncbi:MAG: FIG00880187: hypothetical protein [uncultured Sphingomonadaceae bacterium]|uniref:Membrane protein YkvI n=1 Tax=uncultured Sphingomonadaceae bacterium TaxID=169976 RepID=A0A6J4RRX3_9SPHN|nr:MAG: FIG00880187: hypothetical protein [uncultured Sphingomonadaceae bacterium]
MPEVSDAAAGANAHAGRPSRFQRFLLPGLAFKALVIGGGYATGREVAEFFLPSGPWGGVYAILLATFLFSAACILTFLFARAARSFDYQSFFAALLGPGWVVWEVAYILFVILILAVYGAAAGAIGAAALGWPALAGTTALMIGIIIFTTFGNRAVERLFEWAAYLLYGVYALFFVFAFTTFGDRIADGFASAAPADAGSWALNGGTYFSYNILGAIVVLPVLRHLTSSRDAVIAGAICGPLAMLPALLFFVATVAFYPTIMGAELPSDTLLAAMDRPWFRGLFQLMVFSALLQSGVSAVHAFNERVDAAWRRSRGLPIGARARLLISLGLLAGCMFLADRFGLVALIGSGYRFFAYVLLAVFVVPLCTVGVGRVLKNARETAAP